MDILLNEDVVTETLPPFQYLNEDFYTGMRNELTSSRIHHLKEWSQKIALSNFIGTYNSELHFLETLDFFLQSTHETRHRGMFLLRKVLSSLQNHENFIDVGAATGTITCWLGNQFSNVTVLDSNQEAISAFNTKKTLLRNKIKLNKILGNVLDVALPNNHYDLALLSHVLYYIDHNRWLEATQKLYDSIKPGGMLVVVMNGDGLGKLKLIKHFNGNQLKINDYIRNCVKYFNHAKIDVFVSNEVAQAANLLSMLHITGFFLYDVNAIATKEAMEKYINNHLKTNDDTYQITFPQKFILIRK